VRGVEEQRVLERACLQLFLWGLLWVFGVFVWIKGACLSRRAGIDVDSFENKRPRRWLLLCRRCLVTYRFNTHRGEEELAGLVDGALQARVVLVEGLGAVLFLGSVCVCVCVNRGLVVVGGRGCCWMWFLAVADECTCKYRYIHTVHITITQYRCTQASMYLSIYVFD
jgi:hypothetical protein